MTGFWRASKCLGSLNEQELSIANHTQPSAQKRLLTYLFLITALGLILRIARLNMPLWGDEVASWAFARRTPFWSMWKFASYDPTPPLYYALLHFTIPVLGITPAALRLPSVVFGTALIPLAYWSLDRAGFPQRDKLAGALVIAVASSLIYYAQEARAYAMLAFFGMLSVFVLYEVILARRPIYDILLAGIVLILAYTHRSSYFLIVAELLCLLLYRSWRTLIIVTAAFGGVVLLLLWQVLGQSFNYGAAGDVADVSAILSLINTLNIGTLGMQSITKMANGPALQFPNQTINFLAPIAGFVIFALTFIWGGVSFRAKQPAQQRYITVLSICIVVPVGLALLAGSSLSPRPQWLLRGLVYVWPLYLILAITALSMARTWIYRLTVTSIVILNGLSLYPYYTSYTRFNDEPLFKQLNQLATSNDLIVSDPWYMRDVIDYYLDREVPIVGFSREQGWIDLDRLQRSDEYTLVPLAKPPQPSGRIFVYYRQSNLSWANNFPTTMIYVYDSRLQTWKAYQRPKP